MNGLKMKIPFGVHIVFFEGGLGNQMFEYAFYLSLREKCPLAFYGFDTYAAEVEHYGYELDKIFHIDSHRERNRHSFLRKLERHHYVEFTEVQEENAITYNPKVYEDIRHPHVYKGYWQTEKYFEHIADDVRKAFRYRDEKLSEQTKKMAAEIQKMRNPVSLHVRRGDYVGLSDTKTFGMEYYDAAVKMMREKYSGGTIVVFSDDPEWAKTNMPYVDMVVVDWNKGKDSWQDMYLMSQCTHNIIANSSFSWWGAWLNAHLDKQVIAPKKWMTWESEESDVVPQAWIRM